MPSSLRKLNIRVRPESKHRNSRTVLRGSVFLPSCFTCATTPVMFAVSKRKSDILVLLSIFSLSPLPLPLPSGFINCDHPTRKPNGVTVEGMHSIFTNKKQMKQVGGKQHRSTLRPPAHRLCVVGTHPPQCSFSRWQPTTFYTLLT